MTDKPEKIPTIENNIKIALANAGDWVGPADTGAITTLLRLARLCDALFDAGEAKDLAPLLGRLQSLMDALQLTPKSRQALTQLDDKAKTDGKQFAADYLRLIQTPHRNDTAKRAKPRPDR